MLERCSIRTRVPSRIMIRHSASHLLAADFEYVPGIVDRNWIGDGPLCAELKELLATHFGHSEVVLTESGAAALLLGLLALHEHDPERTKVVTSAYVCPAVVSAIVQAGLEPVFADTCKDSLSIDMAAVANRVNGKSLAIICTNTGGIPDDYTAAEAFGIPVISDCAQGIGTRVGGRDLASEGTCSILSFGPTKMLTAGRGGALLCRTESLGKTLAKLAKEELSVEEYRRSGFRATWGQHVGELTAGLAAAQFRRLEALIDRRRQIAHSYDQVLRERTDVSLMQEGGLARFNRFRYYFLSNRASAWVEHLRSLEIDARRSIAHVMAEYFGSLKAFPHLDRVSNMVVSVPIYPAMTNAEADTVAEALRSSPKGEK